MIVGAYAVGFHGRPRTTGDLDIFVEASQDNSEKLEAALRRFGFASVGLSAQDFLRPDQIVQLGFPPNRIDIATGLSGVGFQECWDTRVSDVLDGVPVQFISRELLIRNKRAAGRPKDIADAEAIERRNA